MEKRKREKKRWKMLIKKIMMQKNLTTTHPTSEIFTFNFISNAYIQAQAALNTIHYIPLHAQANGKRNKNE